MAEAYHKRRRPARKASFQTLEVDCTRKSVDVVEKIYQERDREEVEKKYADG